MRGSHLGWRASALSDGELTDEELARAWTHYRMCAWCREQVDGQREIRSHMGKASGPHIPPDVLTELYATPQFAGAVTAVAQPAGSGRASRRPPRRKARRGRSLVRGAAMASGVVGTLVAVVFTGAFVLGDPVLSASEAVAAARETAADGVLEPVPRSHLAPAYAEEESVAMLAWMAEAGWSVPHSLPHGYYLADFTYSRSDGESLATVVATPSGSISLALIHGRVDPSSLGSLTARQIGGRTVYCEEVDGHLTGVTDSGGELLAFVSDASEEELATVLDNSPDAKPIDASTRLARGWDQIRKLLT
jgi:hypothetical protein